MITEAQRFPIFIVVSLVVFTLILGFVLRQRPLRLSFGAIAVVAVVVVVGGMLFAKYGQNLDWPWWIYYTVPALTTLLLPLIAFRFTAAELWPYLSLAFLSSPVIHILFSFLLGWHEYMPFLPVPSLQDLLTGDRLGR